jgi:hypothetical protein
MVLRIVNLDAIAMAALQKNLVGRERSGFVGGRLCWRSRELCRRIFKILPLCLGVKIRPLETTIRAVEKRIVGSTLEQHFEDLVTEGTLLADKPIVGL